MSYSIEPTIPGKLMQERRLIMHASYDGLSSVSRRNIYGNWGQSPISRSCFRRLDGLFRPSDGQGAEPSAHRMLQFTQPAVGCQRAARLNVPNQPPSLL